ncbi:hypothetical protein EOW77_0034365 [Bradyrhizobium yuanmingense]|nr:hypothetical protein EOW77_0034365 [Bradyrhizobium yuanmingense]
MGDLHQPLHVSFGDGRGGNEVTTIGECQTNLHSTWDTCLVLRAVDRVRAATRPRAAGLGPEGSESFPPESWALEHMAVPCILSSTISTTSVGPRFAATSPPRGRSCRQR